MCAVADKITTFRLSDIEIIMVTALANVEKTVWKSCVKHTENLQNEDFRSRVIGNL
jgi:hypothetical protein